MFRLAGDERGPRDRLVDVTVAEEAEEVLLNRVGCHPQPPDTLLKRPPHLREGRAHREVVGEPLPMLLGREQFEIGDEPEEEDRRPRRCRCTPVLLHREQVLHLLVGGADAPLRRSCFNASSTGPRSAADKRFRSSSAERRVSGASGTSVKVATSSESSAAVRSPTGRNTRRGFSKWSRSSTSFVAVACQGATASPATSIRAAQCVPPPSASASRRGEALHHRREEVGRRAADAGRPSREARPEPLQALLRDEVVEVVVGVTLQHRGAHRAASLRWSMG